MERIDTATADPNGNGTGKAGFVDGTPPTIPPTDLDSNWFNNVQEEIVNVATTFGETLDGTNKTQMVLGIQMLAKMIVFFSGFIRRWFLRTVPTTREWTSVIFASGFSSGASLWVAVAKDGTTAQQIVTSPDRITWSAQTSPSARQWTAVTQAGLGLIVAVANDGTAANQIMHSADGVTWVSSTNPAPSARQWTSISSGSGAGAVFAAVAQDGTAAQQVMTSSIVDGNTWVAHSAPSAQQWQSICWSNGLALFIAVANNGTAAQQVMTSPDGSAWTPRTSAGVHPWSSVAAGLTPLGTQIVVAVATDGAVMTSPDGITWTMGTAPSARNWTGVAFNFEFGGFVAVANDGIVQLQIMASQDGAQWGSIPSPSAQTWSCIGAGGPLGFVAMAQNGSTTTQVMANL